MPTGGAEEGGGQHSPSRQRPCGSAQMTPSTFLSESLQRSGGRRGSASGADRGTRLVRRVWRVGRTGSAPQSRAGSPSPPPRSRPATALATCRPSGTDSGHRTRRVGPTTRPALVVATAHGCDAHSWLASMRAQPLPTRAVQRRLTCGHRQQDMATRIEKTKKTIHKFPCCQIWIADAFRLYVTLAAQKRDTRRCPRTRDSNDAQLFRSPRHRAHSHVLPLRWGRAVGRAVRWPHGEPLILLTSASSGRLPPRRSAPAPTRSASAGEE